MENRALEDMNAVVDLMAKLDVSEFDILDQMVLGLAFAKFISEVKPVYAKYAAKDPSITNFIMKL